MNNLEDLSILYNDSIEDKKIQNIIISWSGGYDSTLLLMKVLDTVKRLNEKNKTNIRVCTISVEPETNLLSKRAQERNSRERIKFKLEEKGYSFDSVIVKTSMESFMTCNTNAQDVIGQYNNNKRVQITQPAMWLAQVLPFISDHTLLLFGYIKEDDIWQYKQSFLKLLQANTELLGIAKLYISFPFMYKSKVDILRELITLDKEVYDKCWTCEKPDNGKPCGNCHPCKAKKEAQIRYITNECISSDIVDNIFKDSTIDKIVELNKALQEYAK